MARFVDSVKAFWPLFTFWAVRTQWQLLQNTDSCDHQPSFASLRQNAIVMRFFLLLLLLCLAVGLSEGRRGYSSTRRTLSVSMTNQDVFQKTSAPATPGHENKVATETDIDRSKPQKRRNILPQFLKIPLKTSLLLGKVTARGFFWGYPVGAVYGLWGLVKDALAGENGIREVHDRSFTWGKNYAKFWLYLLQSFRDCGSSITLPATPEWLTTLRQLAQLTTRHTTWSSKERIKLIENMELRIRWV